MATQELYEGMMGYVYWKKTINKSIVGDQWKALDQLEKILTKANIPIPDMSENK